MNREHVTIWALAAGIAAAGSSPALAKDDPKPKLSVDPIVARTLLAPVDERRDSLAGYRLDPGSDPASGQRAKLSLEVGKATLFAITGRLARQPIPTGPLDPGHAKLLGQRRDGGKVYGAGVSHMVRGVHLSATYQYSKVTAGQPGPELETYTDGPGRSHSLKATARIRFKP